MFLSAHTLGCKLNQLETESIADAFCRSGFDLVRNGKDGAGIVVVNTCTVTSMAEQKARRLIRRLLRDYPGACIIVTGCYAQLDRDKIEKEFSERVFAVPGENKDILIDLGVFLGNLGLDGAWVERELPELIGVWMTKNTGDRADLKDRTFRFRQEKFTSHSRGFMKIQDGCDRCCSYCRVGLARGRSRSLGAKEALEELRGLEQRGFNEAVLTGVNITQYRDSKLEFPDLSGLLEFLLDGTEKIRIRLSSIDPDLLNDRFFTVLANRRIRPHYHLSIQSGSEEILAKMGRHYTPADIEKTVEKLRLAQEDPFLACDIIAAFPGESEAEFEKTRLLCEKTGFAWIHAFPFSRRPGTPAYDFGGRVNEKEAKRRVKLLANLAQKGRLEYIRRWKGRELEAIIERGKGENGIFVPALSENYLKLSVDCENRDYASGPVPGRGSLIKCRLKEESPEYPVFDACAELIHSNWENPAQ